METILVTTKMIAYQRNAKLETCPFAKIRTKQPLPNLSVLEVTFVTVAKQYPLLTSVKTLELRLNPQLWPRKPKPFALPPARHHIMQ